jgi:hypothetical protein
VIKLTDFPLKPETAKNILKYEVFLHQCRNVTMVFVLEMPMRFNDMHQASDAYLAEEVKLHDDKV